MARNKKKDKKIKGMSTNSFFFLLQGVTPKVWGYKSARGLYFFR